jgi:tetratricopeptide (TPR) repeat protein
LAQGRHEEAAADFTEAVRRDPGHAAALAARGDARAGVGDFDRAVVDHLEAIRVNPKSAAAHDAFARLWLTWPDPLQHNPRLAADLAEKACELSGWGDPACLATLTAARRLLAEPEAQSEDDGDRVSRSPKREARATAIE